MQGENIVKETSSVSLVAGPSLVHLSPTVILKEGGVQKWGNFLNRYMSRWLALYEDHLVYYKTGADKTTYKGSIRLEGIEVQKENACSFLITNNDDFNIRIRAETAVQMHEWVSAIEIAKAKMIASANSADDKLQSSTFSDHSEFQVVIPMMGPKLDSLHSCGHMISQHHQAMMGILIEFATCKTMDCSHRLKDIHSKSSLLFFSSISFLNAFSKFMTLARDEVVRWNKILDRSIRYNKHLEDLVEKMAKHHNLLERIVADNVSKAVESSDSKLEMNELNIPMFSKLTTILKQNQQLIKHGASPNSVSGNPAKGKSYCRKYTLRRNMIHERPVFYHLKFWNIIKKCLYKDCIQMPMPSWYLEPLTMLQRLTATFEYSDLLDRASECKDSCEQMVYVCGFVVSCYSAHKHRVSKPFASFLGETYECDRTEDLGWRCVSERVGFHPPVMAQHCEGKNWTLWQNVYLSSEFIGKNLEIKATGPIHLTFKGPEEGEVNHYTWNRLTATVNNIIIGQMNVSFKGLITVTNHKTEDSCVLKFVPPNFMSKLGKMSKVIGIVKNKEGKTRWLLNGSLETKLEGTNVILEQNESNTRELVARPNASTLVWQRKETPDHMGRMYFFGSLDVQLNEHEERVAPTDSRRRVDVRRLEAGDAIQANNLKVKLEASQKKKTIALRSLVPTWFKEALDPLDAASFIYEGKYWECKEEQNWTDCPENFFEIQ